MRKILLFALLLVGSHSVLLSQTRSPGIHVSGGCSYDSIYSSNIGLSCNATGMYSFAGGYLSNAQGGSSFAFEYVSKASQQYSYAMGRNARALGSSSIALGFFVETQQSNSIVIGSGIHSRSPLTALNPGITLGMGSTLPTLFISKADEDLKTGSVAIGNVDPHAKLHIRSDSNEDAGILIEPTTPLVNSAYIQIKDDDHHITVDCTNKMTVSAGNNNELGITSSNFKIANRLMNLGVIGDRNLTFTTQGVPSIGSNAHPSSGGGYSRNAIGPSYVMEFGSSGLLLRTATYQEPRYDHINNWNDALSIKTDGAITLNGRVGVNIENTTNDYALAVSGGVIATKVYIQDVNEWPDYVFGNGRRPMPLGELREYIGENRHLPGVPSEAEVKEQGYDVAEMQSVLLEKIEELTLYMLRQQEEIDSLRTLVTVSFGYDACGNRTSRTIAFSKADEGRGEASLRDSFVGCDAMLFPNPTEGGFILSLTGDDIPQATATLCAMDGKVIGERRLSGAVEEFDLGGKPAGVYLLRLTSGQETKVWKVIKRN